jgi:hypothetical protein
MFAADQVAQLLIHPRLANAKLQARLEVASLVEAKLLVAEIIRMGRQLTPFGRQLGWKVGATNDSSLNHCFTSQLIKSIELNLSVSLHLYST